MELENLRGYYDSKIKDLRDERAGIAGMLKMAKAIDRELTQERGKQQNNKEKTIDL